MFVVSNPFLEKWWSDYVETLQDQTVEEHYHGTKLTCDLSKMPCKSKECGICGISKLGLDQTRIKSFPHFQRFGKGFYLAPNSSKCHDYTEGANGYRAMLLCEVCPGKKDHLQQNNKQLSSPPQGYDSVYGEVGGSFNYPEIVVYKPNAVKPRYIIVYQKDGVHKLVSADIP